MGRLILCIIFPPIIPFVLLYSIFTGGSGVKAGLRANGRKLDLNTLAILDPTAARAQIEREKRMKAIQGGFTLAIAAVVVALFVFARNDTPATPVQHAVYTPAVTPVAQAATADEFNAQHPSMPAATRPAPAATTAAAPMSCDVILAEGKAASAGRPVYQMLQHDYDLWAKHGAAKWDWSNCSGTKLATIGLWAGGR